MSKQKPKPKFKPLDLGPLPVDQINKALQLELEPGEVIFSIPAQRHAADRHPDDFLACLSFVGITVKDPAYVGDDFKNPGKIELIRRMPDAQGLGQGLLVAIVIEPDDKGRYHVASMYPITQREIDRRRQAKRLKNVT